MNTFWKVFVIVLSVLVVGLVVYIAAGGGLPIEKSVQFTIHVGVSGNFEIAIDPTEVSCTKGQVLTFNIVATPTGGFDADIQLGISGLPEGSYTLGASVLTPTSLTTTLTVNTGLLESNASYVCNVNAHDI